MICISKIPTSCIGDTFVFNYSGSVRESDELMLGPFDDGQFQKVTVKTVHRHRLPCRLIQAGQASTVALENVERANIRKVSLYDIFC